MPRFTKEHLFHIRPIASLVEETHETGHELKRAVSSWQLTAMGVGAIIGTGIFVVIGEGAAIAGPSVILSFALAALACVFSALSYAELVELVQRRLQDEKEYVLVAESFSGPVAIEIAATLPANLKALVLCATFISNPSTVPQSVRALLRGPFFRLEPPQFFIERSHRRL